VWSENSVSCSLGGGRFDRRILGADIEAQQAMGAAPPSPAMASGSATAWRKINSSKVEPT